MKKLYFLLLVPVLGLTSCLKKTDYTCNPVPTTLTANPSEVTILRQMLEDKGIEATEDPRGFFYSIGVPGSTTRPNNCSTLTLDYALKLLDGTPIESSSDITFGLGGLIPGWKEALPLIGTGGVITFYLPPSLAYGAQGNQSIPPNAYLEFLVNLKAVN